MLTIQISYINVDTCQVQWTFVQGNLVENSNLALQATLLGIGFNQSLLLTMSFTVRTTATIPDNLLIISAAA